jgi:hypothetical protein
VGIALTREKHAGAEQDFCIESGAHHPKYTQCHSEEGFVAHGEGEI